jgi:hypothetical protein
VQDVAHSLLTVLISIAAHTRTSQKYFAMLLALLPKLRELVAFQTHSTALMAIASTSPCYLAKTLIAKLTH